MRYARLNRLAFIVWSNYKKLLKAINCMREVPGSAITSKPNSLFRSSKRWIQKPQTQKVVDAEPLHTT